MRTMKADDLGVDHEVRIFNKTDSFGLADKFLRDSIRQEKPDYIYVHLGINDLHKKRSLSTIMAAFDEFVLFVDEEVPHSKLIFSMPLLNGNKNTYPQILELRERMYNMITTMDTKTGFGNRDILFNPNTNFFKKDSDGHVVRTAQSTELFDTVKGDYIHLSQVGQRVIRANFRHMIHRITSEVEESYGHRYF